MQAQQFILWHQNYVKQARLNNERRLIVLSGNEEWALTLLQSIDPIKACLSSQTEGHSQPSGESTQCLIYGDSNVFPANVQKKRYRDKLGSESDVIIFADSIFTIDAFAALSGTLKAGGLLFLVTPSINKYAQESLFFKRFYSLIKTFSCHTVISQSQAEISPLSISTTETKTGQNQEQPQYSFGCITAEQYKAVQAVNKVVTGHRKRPLVLTADRGRGKSSALAIACVQLLKAHENDGFKVVITAPDIQALTVFFKQLNKDLPSAEHLANTIVFGQASIVFIPVDQLLRQPVQVNLLLVDEAAAIPVYLLEKLLESYHRTVFSSTIHGYEGAGRGFTLKFQHTLRKVCPQWTSLHIKQPIRWRQNDPLERLVFNTCLLNAELPLLTQQSQENTEDKSTTKLQILSTSVFKVISAVELVKNEPLLQQVFAVLVTAHYQTKPSDLQLLLDNPQIQLACLFSNNSNTAEVIAVALLMQEGKGFGIEESDIKAIKDSQRRLRNHFLPQSLLSHTGFEQAFDYSYLRIMRIAVHPQIQQQGIGLHFLSKIQQIAKQKSVDFIGSSFGVNYELLRFWLKAGFTTVRIGFTKDKASGEQSALMVQGVSSSAGKIQGHFEYDFYRSFDYLLLEEYQTLASNLVRLLLTHNAKEFLTELSTIDIDNVQAYATGQRLYSSCAYSLYLWFKHDLLTHVKHPNSAVIQDSLVLIARLIQKHSIKTVCQSYGFTGKKMLNQHIKDYVCMRLKP